MKSVNEGSMNPMHLNYIASQKPIRCSAFSKKRIPPEDNHRIYFNKKEYDAVIEIYESNAAECAQYEGIVDLYLSALWAKGTQKEKCIELIHQFEKRFKTSRWTEQWLGQDD